MNHLIIINIRRISIIKRYFVISVNGAIDGVISINSNKISNIIQEVEPLVKRYIDINYSVYIDTWVKIHDNAYLVDDIKNKIPISVTIKQVSLWTEEDITNY